MPELMDEFSDACPCEASSKSEWSSDRLLQTPTHVHRRLWIVYKGPSAAENTESKMRSTRT